MHCLDIVADSANIDKNRIYVIGDQFKACS